MHTLFIDIDSLRPDHVGAYNYDPPTTPNIDRLAEDSIRFTNAYVANSPCMPSRAGLISGRFGINNGIVTHGSEAQVMHGPQWVDWDEPRSSYYTLPERLFHERIPTVAVSSFPRHPSPWFYHIWHEYRHPQEPETGDIEYFQTPRASEVADIAQELHQRYAEGDSSFVYAQFWDPHSPYKRTDEEIEVFRGYDLPQYPTTEMIQEHQSWDAFRSATEMEIQDRSDLEDLIANYDAEIRYTDDHVGRLMDYLQEQNMYDDTLIVLTADHGEEFGEHGLYREHWSTHDGTQRVPLVIKPPADAAAEPGVRDQLVTNVDVAPTILDYANVDAPAAWQGKSLRPVIENESAEWRDEIVIEHGLYTAQRAVRTDRWKFIKTYHTGMWGGVVPERQLFDLQRDPWEQDDVSAAHPDVVDDLETRMARWAEDHVGPYEDPMHRIARVEPSGHRARSPRYDGV